MRKFLPAVALFLTTHALAKEDYRNQLCKTPEVAAGCFQTHARLWSGNGTPSTRLWPIGTHRIYGIYSNQYGFKHDETTLDNESPHLPIAVAAAVGRIWKRSGLSGWTLYGDFEVCPLEPHLQGHMQAACIAHASHIVVPKEE